MKNPAKVISNGGEKVKRNKKGQFAEGCKRPVNSGREKGTPNKTTMQLIDLIAKKYPNYNPVIAMIEIGCDMENDAEIRLKAHKEVAPYLFPRRKAVEHILPTDNQNTQEAFIAYLRSQNVD